MTVYGYVRVSTTRQASEGESLDVQRRQIEGHAMVYGLAVDEFVVEEGVSGSVPVGQRPAGGVLFRKLQPGDVVIAAKLDRLFRSALDALQVVADLRTREVRLHLIDLGGDIAGNGLSKLFLTIASAFAEAERDRIRERVTQVKQDQKKRGRYLGGKVPFGWRVGNDGELVEESREQEAIRDMVLQRFMMKKPLRQIAANISARGISVSHVAVKDITDRHRPAPAEQENA